MKRLPLLFLILLCPKLSVKAQTTDNHVYVTDVINNVATGWGPIKQKIDTDYSEYIFKYNRSGQGFEFNSDSESKCAFITTNSNGFVKKVELNCTINSINSFPTIEFYGKNSNYSDNIDVYTSGSTGDVVGQLEFSKQDPTLSLDFDTPHYRHIAFKNISSQVLFIQQINITWQLAHFRDNLTAGNLGTICLPYAVNADDLQDYITAYRIVGKEVEGDDVKCVIFEEVDRMEAGVPYVFVAKSNTMALPFCGTKAETPNNIATNGLYGTFENHPFSDDHQKDYFVITGNKIQAASPNSGVDANRAFIKMNDVPVCNAANSPARKLILTTDGYTQTGEHPTITTTTPTGEAEAKTYDLAGRRIASTATQRVTISNGKKTIIR